jgi:diketogulonate reductase-like aldo/keto reductase
VWQVPDDEAATAVAHALAAAHGNEEGTGGALASSGLPREEPFVTTKPGNDDQGHDSALRAFDASPAGPGREYVDLHPIHWPVPARDRCAAGWKALETILGEGRVRAIGVSGLTPAHLRRIAEESGITPAVNQIEPHPNLPRAGTRAAHAGSGIVTEAWSPPGQGMGLLDEPLLSRLGAKHGRTPAQAAPRRHIRLGHGGVPTSVTPSRIAGNIDVFGFEPDEEGMAAVAAPDNGRRPGLDPGGPEFG